MKAAPTPPAAAPTPLRVASDSKWFLATLPPRALSIASAARMTLAPAFLSYGSVTRTARKGCSQSVAMAEEQRRKRFSKGSRRRRASSATLTRSEEHTSELQSHSDLVCRLL